MQRIERLSGVFPLFMQVFSKLRVSVNCPKLGSGNRYSRTMKKAILGVVLSLALAAFFAAPASAENFCAGTVTPTVCTAPNTFGGDLNGIIDAMVETTNNLGPDKVYIGPGTYPVGSGLISTFLENVEVIGSGVDQTIFTSSSSSANYLDMTFADATSVIRGFTLNITGAPNQSVGLRVANGRAEDFKVVDQTGGTANNLRAVSLENGATAVDFDASVTGNGNAVLMNSGNATIERARLVGSGSTPRGVSASGASTFTIANSTFHDFDEAIQADSGTIEVTDTAIALGPLTNATGIEVYNQNNGSVPINLDVDRVTIYGNVALQRAVRLGADFTTETVTATIRNSLTHMPASNSNAIVCLQDNFGTVNLTVEDTAYDPAKFIETIQNCNITFPTNQIDTTIDVPTFVDADGGDLRHAAGSPMIDRLDGSTITPGALDAFGAPRLTDGDGDCVAKLDVGAYEHQATYPLGHPCNPFPPVPPADSPPATPSPTATAKLTTRAKKAFVRSRSGFRKRTNPRATSFGVTFKDAQVARFELEQSVAGVRKGGKCVAKGSGRRCKFFKLLKGIQRIDVTDGQRFFTFGGRFNGKRLKPGTYRAKITPFGGGGLPGQPITVAFKLK